MNQKSINKFKLFSNCIPVKGSRRSLICDVQRGEMKLIPNGLYEILSDYNGKTYDEIIEDYGEDNKPTIDEYFEFLEENEFIFWTPDPENFPDINPEWDYPGSITNAIIDSNENSTHDYAVIFQQLSDLGCKAVQLRFYNTCSLEQIEAILKTAENTRIQHIDFFIKYNDTLNKEAVQKFCTDNLIIQFMCIHSATTNDDKVEIENYSTRVLYTTEAVADHTHCGIIASEYFVVNIPSFLEAKQYNSCLNRKISVDINGDIRNCPSLPKTYGNITTTSLHSALVQKDFKDLWEINKDQIEICKDCEFRFVCTDCRAFLKEPNDKFSKPGKCTYDPYTATWADNANIDAT
ncbi:MAG: grasp-with-spasm system SPASM domain peptide maturase [Chitinophagaceae bacterium]|nr:grasp-with-spasm system SPASM domain peptide maturase [Chitinophagaceae bacterium]